VSRLLDKDGQQLIEIMGTENVHKHPILPLWKIKASSYLPGSDFELKKQNLLRQITKDFPRIFLSYSEDPQEDGISGNWTRMDSITWLVPENARVEEIYAWLYLGNWLIYAASKVPPSHIFEKYSIHKPESFMKIMEEASLELMLGSFHDNTPWILGVRPT
jgi:hypothetical protein